MRRRRSALLPGPPALVQGGLPFNKNWTPGHEYMGTIAALGPSVDEFAIGERVTVEIHAGCGQCKRCRMGMYTSCLNYGLNWGDRDKGHRANGFTTDGGFAEYAVNHINTLIKIADTMSDEEATLVVTAGTAMYGLTELGGLVAGEEDGVDLAGAPVESEEPAGAALVGADEHDAGAGLSAGHPARRGAAVAVQHEVDVDLAVGVPDGADRVRAERIAAGLGQLPPARVPVLADREVREAVAAGDEVVGQRQHDLHALVEPGAAEEVELVAGERDADEARADPADAADLGVERAVRGTQRRADFG